MHGILFLRCHARLITTSRAAVMWQMHVINKLSFVLCSFQIIEPAVAVRLILRFVTILQKYTLTLRIVWTRRCCFYRESKMGMSPQRLLCTLKGSGSGSRPTRSSKSLLLREYYIQCSLHMHNMLLRRLSICHMRNKWWVVNFYILPPVRQF